MKIATRAVTGVSALVLLVALVCGIVNGLLGNRPMPARRELPRSAVVRYRVAVLGDAQKGLANLANLLRKTKDEGVALVLQTGDLVSTNDEGHYRLAALYLSRAELEVPFFVVPGNHDVKGGTERFREEVGKLEWDFELGPVAFIGVDNALGEPPDVKTLERRIARVGPDLAVVLLMHVPPFDVKGEILPAYKPFVEWLAGSRVRYLFCGQVHDYVRRQIGKTIVIANGVGGDYESWQLKQKVYATILEVDGSDLKDRAIELPPEHGFAENVEHFAIGHVAEAYRRFPWACWPGTALLATLSALALRAARRPR